MHSQQCNESLLLFHSIHALLLQAWPHSLELAYGWDLITLEAAAITSVHSLHIQKLYKTWTAARLMSLVFHNDLWLVLDILDQEPHPHSPTGTMKKWYTNILENTESITAVACHWTLITSSTILGNIVSAR
jgi:hypothetical protein